MTSKAIDVLVTPEKYVLPLDLNVAINSVLPSFIAFVNVS